MRDTMQKKFDNLDDLKLTNSLLIMQESVKGWCEARPDNEQLKQVREALLNVTFITNKLQLDRGTYHLAIDQYRNQSTRSIERARRAEEKIAELEKELAVFKKAKELGL